MFEQEHALGERMHGITGDGLLENVDGFTGNAAALGVRKCNIAGRRSRAIRIELVGDHACDLAGAETGGDDQTNAIRCGGGLK
jgi:hypothetical protein